MRQGRLGKKSFWGQSLNLYCRVRKYYYILAKFHDRNIISKTDLNSLNWQYKLSKFLA